VVVRGVGDWFGWHGVGGAPCDGGRTGVVLTVPHRGIRIRRYWLPIPKKGEGKKK